MNAAAEQAIDVTRYYFFTGQPVAMKKDTVLETDSRGNVTVDEKYWAYNKQCVEFHQIGRQTQNGRPIAHERYAIEDIQAATGTKVTFYPDNR